MMYNMTFVHVLALPLASHDADSIMNGMINSLGQGNKNMVQIIFLMM